MPLYFLCTKTHFINPNALANAVAKKLKEYSNLKPQDNLLQITNSGMKSYYAPKIITIPQQEAATQ